MIFFRECFPTVPPVQHKYWVLRVEEWGKRVWYEADRDLDLIDLKPEGILRIADVGAVGSSSGSAKKTLQGSLSEMP